MLKSLVLLIALGSVCLGEGVHKPGDRSDFKKSLKRDCANSYTSTCLKLDIVSWVDKLNEDDDVNLIPGVSVVRENSTARSNTADIVAELAREFPNDPDARLDAFLTRKVAGYLNTHTIKFSLFDANPEESARKGGGGGGGGGGKKGGGYGAILAMGAMMKGTLMAAGMAGLAAIAGKALMAALISLMLSAIVGIKSLASSGGKSTTYEVIAKPIYTHSNTHSSSHEEHGGHYGHSSYGRSFDVPLPLGLQPGYKPAQ
ncbi:DUF1676 domain containing protein [Asbolus verrucosus]|uniref:DUF1676 domain containing protein n=1 Tax=Asbolus verrucosus TaxID=1661398 RepID=A0A482W7H7_ASBVE|nr:DUF1676 domain containing protein [Asbolus verrucosus]